MFDTFDVDGSGAIDTDDIRQQNEVKRSLRRASISESASPSVSTGGASDGSSSQSRLGKPLLTGTVVDTATHDDAWGIGAIAPARRWFSSLGLNIG